MNLTGKILIAHPNCPAESPFHRSVVYVYQHSLQSGTIGVIINKPSRYTVGDICAEKQLTYLGQPVPLYHGGPVSPHSLIMLHTNDWRSQNTMKINDALSVTSDNSMLEHLANQNHPINYKLFGGLSGWAPNQLEDELAGKWPYRPENSWLIADIDISFIFKTSVKEQWKEACTLSSKQLFNQFF